MNFDFSDAQKALKKQTRDFLKGACDLTVPRRILEGDEPYAEELWRGLVDIEAPALEPAAAEAARERRARGRKRGRPLRRR